MFSFSNLSRHHSFALYSRYAQCTTETPRGRILLTHPFGCSHMLHRFLNHSYVFMEDCDHRPWLGFEHELLTRTAQHHFFPYRNYRNSSSMESSLVNLLFAKNCVNPFHEGSLVAVHTFPSPRNFSRILTCHRRAEHILPGSCAGKTKVSQYLAQSSHE